MHIGELGLLKTIIETLLDKLHHHKKYLCNMLINGLFHGMI